MLRRTSNFFSSTSHARHRQQGLTFLVNGTKVSVPAHKINTRQTLLEFLRSDLGLTGSKLVCGEGGCGACSVIVSSPTDGAASKTVNACLMPLCAADGLTITTIEGVGSSKAPHPVQQRLAESFSSQCGFCSPGMVMSIVNELQNNPAPTVASLEHCLGSNLCRCTGYRPILDAAKSFAVDPENIPDLKMKMLEGDKSKHIVYSSTRDKIKTRVQHRPLKTSFDSIEDAALKQELAAKFSASLDVRHRQHRDQQQQEQQQGGGDCWHRPSSLEELAQIAAKHKDKLIIAGGFTEINILKKFRVKNDLAIVCNVPELNVLTVDAKTGALVIGSAVTLFSRHSGRGRAAGAEQ